MAEPAVETAIVATVTEVDDAVREYRLELDPAAALGVPAHVTVLYPFLPLALIDGAVLQRLGAIVGNVQPFEVEFSRVEWFAEHVLWLAPEPDAPFRRLTEAFWGAFPEAPPYGGSIADPIPHLTIAEGAALPRMLHAHGGVASRHPTRASITTLSLMSGGAETGSWSTLAELPLGIKVSGRPLEVLR